MIPDSEFKKMQIFASLKDEHFSMAGWTGIPEKEKLYNDFARSYNKYLSAVLSVPTLGGKKPMDPFIAGGLANGIAGPAAGVVTALNQKEKVDQWNTAVRNFDSGRNNMFMAEQKLRTAFSNYTSEIMKYDGVKQSLERELDKYALEKKLAKAEQERRKEEDRRAYAGCLGVFILIVFVAAGFSADSLVLKVIGLCTFVCAFSYIWISKAIEKSKDKKSKNRAEHNTQY